jgi:uridine phosphorylase
MLNHARGLWGYAGPAADGAPLTVQATGVGGPSAAVVVDELIGLGARRIVRAGSCTALDPALRLGDLVAAAPVLAADGASRALGAGPELEGDPALTAALAVAATAMGPVLSADRFHGDPEGEAPAGVLARDMQTAAVLAAAARRGVPAAALLLVTQDAAGRRLDGDELHAAEAALGHAAAAALGLGVRV